AYRLIESGLVPVASVPVEWASIVPTDGIVRAVLPGDILETLTAAVFEMLQLIRQEVVTYDPSFHSNGRRYAPHLARPSGGTWEDRMNRMLLGTGLSVDA